MIESLLRIPSNRRYAAPGGPVSTGTAARRLIVTVMLLAIALDQSYSPTIAPALSAAAGAFGLDRRTTSWLDMSLNIGYLATIVVSVWSIARFGKRAYLGWSLTSFAAFSLVCAIAPTPDIFILARALQGAAAGAFFTCGLLTILATAPHSDLPLAMVLFTAVMLLAPTLAPLYGGAFIEQASWRLVFVGPAFIATRCVGIVAGILAGTLAGRCKIGARALMVFGLAVVAATYLALGIATVEGATLALHVAIGVVQGFAFAVMLGPFATVLFRGVAQDAFASLAVLFKLSVLLGGGIAAAIAATVLKHGASSSTKIQAYADLWLGAAALALVTAAVAGSLHRADASAASAPAVAITPA